MTTRGQNLRDLIRDLRDLGGAAVRVRRTGELRLTHPLMSRPSDRFDSRRKDATRAATVWMKHLREVIEASQIGAGR